MQHLVGNLDGLRVLVGMECSGIIRDEFRKRGADAWSCDLKPCEGDSRWHLQGNVFQEVYADRWDLGIFHPECRYLTVAGARWQTEKSGWMDKQAEAIEFAEAVWGLRRYIPHLAVENPVGFLSTRSKLGKPTQIVQPWMFGDEYKKGTCWWLHNLPGLLPTSDSDGSNAVSACWLHPPTKDPEERRTNRARTYPGHAAAIADQWGAFCIANAGTEALREAQKGQ